MPNKTYLVSAIVSVYNCERFIAGCLEDLEQQTIADKVEIVVVNSGSQQNEDAIIKKFQEKFDNIVYIKTENRETIYQAWNRGIKASSGKYITNANTDDRHRKDAFEIMVNVLEDDKNIALVYCDDIETWTENQTFDNYTPVRYVNRPEFNRNMLLYEPFVGPYPMWRKTLHDEFGYFDGSFKVAGDYEFWLRISEKCKFKYIKEYLGLYLNNPDSAERRDRFSTVSETERVRKEYVHRWADSLSNDTRALEAVRKQISRNYYRQGYWSFSDGLISSAKDAFIQSISYNSWYLKSYFGLLVCYLSPEMVRFLKGIKRIIKVKKLGINNARN